MHRQDGFTLVELLIVLAILGVLVGLVAFGVDPIMAMATERSMQSELVLVQRAIDSYNIVDVTSDGAAPIPARDVGAEIRQTDADAPFAKHLDDTSRYVYTWGKGGSDLAIFGEADSLAAQVSVIMSGAESIVRDVLAMPDTRNDRFSYGQRNWNRRIELLLEQGAIRSPDPQLYGTNVLDYVNPVSGMGSIMDVWTIPSSWKTYYTPPAVLITNNGRYNYDNVADASDVGDLLGTLIIYRPNVGNNEEPAPLEMFYVDADGQPQGLSIIE